MGVWYRVGTVAVTAGSKTVTGAGTQWQNLMFGVAPGTTFYGPDGKPYEVDTVNSNTSLTLATNYAGVTASGQVYSIDPTRQGSVASLAAQTSEVLKFSQEQFTQIQTWFTGAANADVTLESPAGQTISVPSYLKVTSEGEGQAARAKAEADKATAAADLAVNVVGDSALPLPDVWLPLNDDLRMITGFGGDVKVGELTVAKRANFERVTGATYVNKSTGIRETVAVNEPRFEAGGLLLEKASTNLFTAYNFTGSNMTSNNVENSILVKYTDPIMGGDYAQLKSVTGVAAGRYINLSSFAATEGLVYTVTVTVRRPIGSPCSRFRLGSNHLSPGSVYVELAEGQVADVIMTGAVIAGRSSVSCFVWPQIGSDTTAAVPAATPLVDLGDMQAELGTVSTSRIRSSGAQTRREQDKFWLQELGNMLPLNRDFTLSFTADIQYDPADYACFYSSGAYPVMSRFIIFSASTVRFYVGSAIAALTPSQLQAAMPMGAARRVTLIRRGDKSEIWMSGTKLVEGTALSASGYSNDKFILGSDANFARPMPRMHIRDLKVWHFAASEAQAKSIR